MHADDFVRELYDASYRRLVGQLTAFTGSREEAEDVVQEAFARGLLHSETLRSADNPEAWLRTVAVNQASSRWRRLRRYVGLLPDLVPVEPPDTDRAAWMDLFAALRTLPRAQREAIALHHLAGLPVREVADALGIPTGTVKARLARGRTALATLLAVDDIATTETRHA